MTLRARLMLLVLCLLLGGCGTESLLQGAKDFVMPPGRILEWDSVVFNMPPAVNRNFPVAVDIVSIHDPALVEKILGMKAADWFAVRDSLLKTYPTGLQSKSWELAPGDSKRIAGDLFRERRVFAVVAFADYFALGEHRVRLDELRGVVTLEFDSTDFSARMARKQN